MSSGKPSGLKPPTTIPKKVSGVPGVGTIPPGPSSPRPSALPTLKKKDEPTPRSGQVSRAGSTLTKPDEGAFLTPPEETDTFIIGETVYVNGTKRGKISFIGETHFGQGGDWAGIVYDEPIGKNDGSVGGTRYFQCEPLHGAFTRLTRLTRKPLVPLDPDSCRVHGATPPRCLVERQRSPSPFTATSPITGTPKLRQGSPAPLKIGERVIVQSSTGTKKGTLKYLGTTSFADGEWAGIELDQPLGKNDGTVGGVRYFSCRDKYGLFALANKVSSSPANRTPSFVIKRHGSRESLQSNMSSASRGIRSVRRPNAGASGTQCLPTCTLQPAIKEIEKHLEQVMRERDLEKHELAQITSLLDERTKECNVLTEYKIASMTQIDSYQQQLDQQKKQIETLSLKLEEKNKKLDDIQFQYEEDHIANNDLTLEAQKLSQENKELLEKIKNLEVVKSEGQGKSADISSLESKLSEMEAREKTQREEITKLMSQVSSTDTVIKSQETTLAERNQVIAELKEQLKNKDQEIEKLNSRVDELNKQYDDKLNEITEITEKLNKIKSINESHSLSVDQKDNQVKVLTEELDSKSKLALKLESELKNLQAEKLQSDAELVKIKQDLESSKAQLQNVTKTLEASIKQKEDELNKVKAEISSKINEITTIKSEADQLTKELQGRNNELELIRSSLSESKSNENVLQGTLNELKAANAQNHSLQKELKEVQDNLIAEQKRVSTLESALSTKEAEIKEREIKQEIEINNISIDIASKVKEINSMKTEIERLKQELEEKNNELEKIRNSLSESANANELISQGALTELKAAKQQLETLRVELKESQEKILQEQKNISTLQSSISAKENELKKTSEQNQNLTKQIETLNEQLEKLKNELTQNQSSLENEKSSSKAFQQKLEAFVADTLKQKEGVDKQTVSLNQEILKLNNEVAQAKTALEQGKATEQSLNEQITSLTTMQKKQNEEFQETSKKVADVLQKTINESNTLKQELKDTQDKFVEDTNITKAAMQKLETQILAKDNEIKTLEVKLLETTKEVELKTNEIESLRKELKESNDTIVKEQHASKSFKESLEAAKEGQAKLSENSSCKIDLLNKDIDQLRHECKNTKDALSKSQADAKELKKTMEALLAVKEDEVIDIRARLNEAEKTLETMESSLSVAKTKENDLLARVSNMDLECSDLKADYDKTKEKLAEITHLFSTHKKEWEEEIIKIKGIHSKEISQYKATISTLESEMEKLRVLLQKSEAKIQELKSKPQILNEGDEVKQLRSDLASSQQNLDFLNSIIVDLQEKNVGLQQKIDILMPGSGLPDANLNVQKGQSSKQQTFVSSRLYCDICEEFDLHDTDDCSKQSNEEDINSSHHGVHGERPYCENCEMFGHSTETCDDGETF